MATLRPSMFGHMQQDTTGLAFFEPYSVKATNGLFEHMPLVINDPTGDHGAYGQFSIPKTSVDQDWTSRERRKAERRGGGPHMDPVQFSTTYLRKWVLERWTTRTTTART